MRRAILWITVGGALALLALAGCTGSVEPAQAVGEAVRPAAEDGAPAERPDPTGPPSGRTEEDLGGPGGDTGTTRDPGPADPRPSWLGTRLLPLREDGLGAVLPTPPELTDRRLPPPPGQPRAPGPEFVAEIDPVPVEVLGRSSWHPGCPVTAEQLRWVRVSFWGFDARPYEGELLVHESAAEALVEVFEQLHAEQFPIEEMRVVTAEEIDAHPTGDGNITTAFACRSTVQGSAWSQHAFGLAVDVNPFHNPYVRGDLVVPELASAYVDRDDFRPGMIADGDVVTEAFSSIGWGWGGHWRSATDPMHFSATGR